MKNCLIHQQGARSTQGRITAGLKQWISLIVVAVVASSTLAEEAFPSGQAVLAAARLQQSEQQIDLRGQLRQDATIVPFRLVQNGVVVRYIFSNPNEVLQLKLGANDSRLEEITRTGSDQITGSDFTAKVRGTAITYEDLALKFLYWSNARVVGSDSIQTRDCWRVLLIAPRRESQYATMFLWVEKGSGALMRLQGFNAAGRMMKRFEVISVQKIENRWYLRQMRVETLDPPTGRVLARTYLEINK